jgi:hypothetical protein
MFRFSCDMKNLGLRRILKGSLYHRISAKLALVIKRENLSKSGPSTVDAALHCPDNDPADVSRFLI